VSDPIKTSDLKIVTSWKTRMKNNAGTASDKLILVSNGTVITGGATTMSGSTNVEVVEPDTGATRTSIAPYGYGLPQVAGQDPVAESRETPYKVAEQQFGNYTLAAGLDMDAKPLGSRQDGTGAAYDEGYGIEDSGAYTPGSTGYTDPMQAVMGFGWEELRAGDIVTVKVVYIPTGKTILSKDVAVTEA
jgi:hypothetical protein